MKEREYNAILSVIRSHINKEICAPRQLDEILKESFPHIPEDTLSSIYTFEFQRKIKRERSKHFKCIDNLYNIYMKTVAGGVRGTLLKLAEENSIPPSLLAKMILEKHYENLAKKDETLGKSKSFFSQAIKDTTLIDDPHLAYEVFLCNLHDDQYGPIAECIHYSVGQQYEFLLHQKVKELNLPFHNEDDMRLKGYDKTPDVKLEVPFAVNGFIVHWIESKALFGDEECHAGYLRDQFLSYWNRFGTGLVIYWFGFIDTLGESCGEKMIIMDHFPSNIVVMNPKLITYDPIEPLKFQ